MNQVNIISFFRKYCHQILNPALIPLVFCCLSTSAETLKIQQVLVDGKKSIDGLDNPRQVKLSPDGKTVFVTSADDNALLVLLFDEQLTPLALFKNGTDHRYKLEGASGISVFNNGNNIAVAGFYDSAITLFGTTSPEGFEFIKAYSNDLDYQRVFKSNESLASEDEYGLLGIFDVVSDEKNQKLYAASYKSNGIAVFNITEQGELKFDSKYSANDVWQTPGGPVTMAVSELNNTLVVAGFEGNLLSLFSKRDDGKLTLSQTIKNGVNGIEKLQTPQKLIFSSNGRFLYVACAGSSTIMAFEYEDNQYLYRQTMTHEDTGGEGLAGVGSLALSPDGATLYAGGEFDEGLLIFDVASNGDLTFRRRFQSTQHKIAGVTSIATSPDGQSLLLTLGKMDALYLITDS